MRIRNKGRRISKKLITGSDDSRQHISAKVRECKYFLGQYDLPIPQKKKISEMSDTELLEEWDVLTLPNKKKEISDYLVDDSLTLAGCLYLVIRENQIRQELTNRNIDFEVRICSDSYVNRINFTDTSGRMPSAFMARIQKFCEVNDAT